MTLANRYSAALDEWRTTGSTASADALVETENEVLELLNLPLAETEQGLTPWAQERIDIWLADEVDAKFLRKFGPDTGN